MERFRGVERLVMHLPAPLFSEQQLRAGLSLELLQGGCVKRLKKRTKKRDNPDLWRRQRHAQGPNWAWMWPRKERNIRNSGALASRPSVVAEGDRPVAIYCKGETADDRFSLFSFDHWLLTSADRANGTETEGGGS